MFKETCTGFELQQSRDYWREIAERERKRANKLQDELNMFKCIHEKELDFSPLTWMRSALAATRQDDAINPKLKMEANTIQDDAVNPARSMEGRVTELERRLAEWIGDK